MSAVLPTELVVTAFVSALRGGVGGNRPVYDHHVPANPSYPFALVMTVAPVLDPIGSHGDPEGVVELVFAIDAVGKARKHAQWMGDRVRNLVMNRLPSGEFMLPVAAAGWVNVDRRTVSGIGAIEREGSDRSFELYVQRAEYAMTWTAA